MGSLDLSNERLNISAEIPPSWPNIPHPEAFHGFTLMKDLTLPSVTEISMPSGAMGAQKGTSVFFLSGVCVCVCVEYIEHIRNYYSMGLIIASKYNPA